MNDTNRNRARRAPDNRYTQLALGFQGGGPPGGKTPTFSEATPHKPTLTEIFNRSASQPVLPGDSSEPNYQKQIDALRRQMSQPKNTLEMTPMGSVNKVINRQRDRWLQQTISALTELKKLQQTQQKTPEQQLGRAVRAGDAKRDFNRAAKGLGMDL